MVERTANPLRSDHDEMRANWPLVVRVAVAASLFIVALVFGLKHFFNVPDVFLVLLTAVLGLGIGSRLPAARPPIPQWLDPEDAWDDVEHTSAPFESGL